MWHDELELEKVCVPGKKKGIKKLEHKHLVGGAFKHCAKVNRCRAGGRRTWIFDAVYNEKKAMPQYALRCSRKHTEYLYRILQIQTNTLVVKNSFFKSAPAESHRIISLCLWPVSHVYITVSPCIILTWFTLFLNTSPAVLFFLLSARLLTPLQMAPYLNRCRADSFTETWKQNCRHRLSKQGLRTQPGHVSHLKTQKAGLSMV